MDEIIGDLIKLALIGVGLGLCLNGAYTAVSAGWPGSYFGRTGSVDGKISSSPVKFAVFRLVPPLVITAAAAVTASRLKLEPVWIASLAVAATHGLRNLQVLLRSLKSGGPGARRKVVYQTIVILGIMLASFFGYVLSDTLAPLFPEPAEFRDSLWTALAAALAGVYLTKVLSKGLSSESLYRRSLRTLDPSVVAHALGAARRMSVDPVIVLGIMTFENSQRPPWVRRLERLVARISGSRTSLTQGVMQVSSNRPLSDTDSIDEALARYQHRWKRPDSYRTETRYQWWAEVARMHTTTHEDELMQAMAIAEGWLESSSSA